MIRKRQLGILLCGISIGALAQTGWAQEMPADYQQVLKIVGRSGDYKSNVLKVNVPRNDLHMKVAGLALPTPFGFGGWFAMTKGDGGRCRELADVCLVVPGTSTFPGQTGKNDNNFHFEDAMLAVNHMLVGLLKARVTAAAC